MSQNHEQVEISTSSNNNNNKNENTIMTISSPTPLKNYVTIVGDKKDNKWLCNFGCRTDPYTGTYSRIRAHFIGLRLGEKNRGIVACPNLSSKDREKLKHEEESAREVFGGNLRKRKHNNDDITPPSTIMPSPPPIPVMMNKRVCEDTVSDNVFIKRPSTSVEDVDTKIARLFYSCGIPFNVARSPFWIEAVKAINEAPKGYKGPSLERIKTALLDKEKISIDNKLVAIKRDWAHYGVSIVSYGWSNVRNQQPMQINVMAVCRGKPVFLTSVASSGEERNGGCISEILLKSIEEVGTYNVVQILTDNAINCKAAGDIIKERHPHVFWSGCMAHSLSLVMKDISKSKHPSLEFVASCYHKAKQVVNYIKNHSFVLHIFRKFPSLKVMQVKKTRFGHHFIVLDRLLRVKDSLNSLVLADEWESLSEGTSKSKLGHDEVKEVILDEQFWKYVEFIWAFTKPIWTMIRFCESDKAVIGEVYQRVEDMLGNVLGELSRHFEMSKEIESLIMTRWERVNMPLHSLAYVLTPHYYSESWLQSLGPGRKKRVKPHGDPFVQGIYLDAVRKLASTEDAPLIRKQLSDFTCDGGVFARLEAIEDRATMSSMEWWNLYGVATPQLYSLAMKVLSQSVSSSCTDGGRAWSSYTFIDNIRRNKVNGDRAEALVYVHHNNRILTRFEDGYEKSYKHWDRNTYEDFLEDDLEGIEDVELTKLHVDE